MFDMSEAMREKAELLLKNNWILIHYSGKLAYFARGTTIGVLEEKRCEGGSVNLCFMDVDRLKAVMALYDCEARNWDY